MVSMTIIIELLVLLTYLLDTNASNISTDEAALLAFKAHITSDPNGMLSKNWTKGTHVCNWIGISCSRRHQRVTSLDLNGLRLRGSIATEIGNLSFLSFLDIGNNSIHGEIPDELGYLRRLKYLSLSMNNLTGQIPASLGLLRRLESLDLSENDLLGSVPSSIFNVSSLKVINLIYNALSGTLPNDICHNLPRLEGLHIARNQLSGQSIDPILSCSIWLKDTRAGPRQYDHLPPQYEGDGINPILSHSIWLRDARPGPGQCDHLRRQYVSSMKVIFCKFPQNTSDLLLVTRAKMIFCCDWKAKMTL